MALFHRKRPRSRGNGTTELPPLGLVVPPRAIIIHNEFGNVTFDGVREMEKEFMRNPRTVTFIDDDEQDNGTPQQPR